MNGGYDMGDMTVSFLTVFNTTFYPDCLNLLYSSWDFSTDGSGKLFLSES